jgi:ubiquinone/menaquinone biosynthesis C-methylase UbiE
VAGARELYDAMAADYVADVERSPYLVLYEQPGLRALLPPLTGRHVLDAGCGAGRNSAWLTEQGADVTGLDASPEMLRRARERVPAASFSVADLAQPLAFSDDTFDVAIASLVLHYLRDWTPALSEFRRVVRAGGVLAVTTHHPLMALDLSPSGDYLATEPVVDRWAVNGRDYQVPFWRRPLSAMVQAFGESGWRIDELGEPPPLPECEARFPEVWERLSRRPEFLFLRLA